MPIPLDWPPARVRLQQSQWDEVTELHRDRHLDLPYPGGESWRQAVARVGWFIEDLSLRWQGCRVLVIGHTATRWAFDHLIDATFN